MAEFNPFGQLADARLRMAQLKMQQEQSLLSRALQQAQLGRYQQEQEQQATLGRVLADLQKPQQVSGSLHARRPVTRSALFEALSAAGLPQAMEYAPQDEKAADPYAGLTGEVANLARIMGRMPTMDEVIEYKSGGGHGGADPFFTPVYTGEGVISFDNRTGTGAPLTVGGKRVVSSTSDPNLQGQIAERKAVGKGTGEAATKARIDLPKVVDEANYTIKLVDDLLAHPGFKSYVGFTLRPGASLVEGTDEASFKIALDQIEGRQFLQAFESLKGGGQITEIEGQKATAALSRMKKANSEVAFEKAAREFQNIITQGVTRAQKKAGGATGGWGDTTNRNGQVKTADDYLSKWK